MPSGPFTKLRAEDQLRGDKLELGGSNGTTFGTLILHPSAVGLKDAVLDVYGNATIRGDLDVKGSVSFETVIVNFKDPNLTLNYDGTDATADGGGITLDRVTTPLPSLVWKNSLNAWAAGLEGSEKEITTQGNAFNGANQLTKLDSNSKIPAYSENTYVHTQAVASSSWVISHSLNRRPSVTVVASTGDMVYGDVAYTDDNNLTVTFTSAFGGRAYLN